MKYYIRLGNMYLQTFDVNTSNSDTEFISTISFCADIEDIYSKGIFYKPIKAKNVISKLSSIFDINEDNLDIKVVQEVDSNE